MDSGGNSNEISGITKTLRFALGLCAVLAVASFLSSGMQMELLSRDYSLAEGEANDSRQEAIAMAALLWQLVTIVIFARWIVRANQNVVAIGATDLRNTPGWALGWFCVPIFNLWRPYQAMKDLWKASHNPTDWTSIKEDSTTSAWWGLWLTSVFLSRASARWDFGTGLEAVQEATKFEMVNEAIYISLCLVAFRMVSQIAAAQSRHARTPSPGFVPQD